MCLSRSLLCMFHVLALACVSNAQSPSVRQIYDRSTHLVESDDEVGMRAFLDSLHALRDRSDDDHVLYDLMRARSYRHSGKKLEAYHALDSIRIDTAKNDPFLSYILRYQQAKVFKDLEIHDRARESAELARIAARRNSLPTEELDMEILACEIELHDGQYERALECFHQALDQGTSANDAAAICRVLIGLGNVYYYQEQDSAALANYRAALVKARESGMHTLVLSAILNAGAALSYTDSPEASIAFYQSVLDTAHSTMWNGMKADILLNMASSFSDLEQHAAAIVRLNEALGIYAELHDTASMAQAHLYKATALWSLGSKAEALRSVRFTHDFTKNTELKASACMKAATFLKELGSTEEAYDLLAEHQQLSDSLAKKKFSKGIATAQIRYETAEKERRITEQDQALTLADEQDRRKSLQRDIAIGSALALVAIALLLWRSLRTRRKLAEQEHELHAKRVDELMHEQEIGAINAMLEGQEKERDRLAKDLHDRLGSMLSAIKHQLGAVEEEVHMVRQDQSAQYTKVHSMLDDAVGEVRRISHDMITVTLSRFGLQKALEDLCDTVRVTGRLDVELRTFGLEQRMERSLEIAVYRIVQESISNVLKHAQATELSVDVTRGPGRLSVIVHDDGKGFDTNMPRSGIGLENVRSRALAIGATLRVESTPGKGTSVSVEGPVVE